MTDGILALDLGTSSIKASMVDRTGTEIHRERVPHATACSSTGAAEQSPEEWWSHTTDIISGLMTNGAIEPVNIVAISLTGQMHGLVLRDDSGDSLGNAITWQDRRSTATLPSLVDRLPEDHGARYDGTIAPGYLVASWHWLRATAPDLTNQVAQVSLPKDDLIYRLTGHHVTDPSDAAGTGLFDPATGTWNATIASAARMPRDLLPEIVPSGAIVGTVKPDVAATLGLTAETQVIVAGGDAAVAAFGAGAVGPHQRLLMLSSGCQVIQPVAERLDAATGGAFIWPSVAPGGSPPWLSVGTTLNGGNAIDWAQRLIRTRFTDETSREVGDQERPEGLRPPMFIPYLDGERAPVSSPGSAGAFIGLNSRHIANDILHATVDGVTLALLDIHVRMGGEIGTDMPLRVGGGGALNEAWLISIAQSFARPLEVFCIPSPSGWGAARTAAVTLGWFDPERDPASWLPDITRVSPSGADAETSRTRLHSFRRIAGVAAELARELDA